MSNESRQRVFEREIVFTDDSGDAYPEWEIATLGAVATNKSKKYDPTKSQEDFRCVELENLNGGGSGVINGWFNSLEQKSGKNSFKSGDVLLSKLRPYLKKWARPNFDGVCSSEIWSISPRSAMLSSAYLYAFIQSPSFQKPLIDITSGTKMPRADWSIVAASEFPMPSLPEQQKIADFFSALDERIALTADKVKLLKEQKQGHLQKVFARELVFTDDNGDAYPEWEQKALGDATVLIKDGSHGTHADDPTGVFLLSAKNIKNNKILYDEGDRKISLEDYSKLYKNYQLREGDLLLTVVGTIGRVALIPSDFPDIAFQRSVAILRFKDDTNASFMLQSFTRQHFQAQLIRSQVVSAQPGIYLNDIAKLSVDLPSHPEQKKIADFFSALDEQIELTESKLVLLKEQKQGYLQGIFG